MSWVSKFSLTMFVDNKMKLYLVLWFFLSLNIFVTCARGVNGGMSCAVCTVLMGVVLQVAEIQQDSLVNTTTQICYRLPGIVQKPCLEIVDKVAPLLDDISEELTPDLFCLLYGTCKTDASQQLCHLFPLPFSEQDVSYKKLIQKSQTLPKIDFCKLPLLDSLCKVLNDSYVSLDAAEDFDGDGFSVMASARGSDWRGKDCVDSDPQIYPGRRPDLDDFISDTNCNGIWGTNTTTKQQYEDLFCRKSESKGIIFIGDSISAHFHMPEIWIDPMQFIVPGLNSSEIILNEIDWPQFSYATGFMNITKNIWIKGTTDSIYLRLRGRNRCNHRDYQNLSQNGASSFEALSHANSTARNQTTDKPAIVVYAMQGNDVCNNFNDTVNHMTEPRVFWKNVMKTLLLLDQKLPYKSHVILVGLVQADFIFGAMAERLHPIDPMRCKGVKFRQPLCSGRLHKNVYYKDLYEWFNCMQIGPCNGWLNSNETLRNITTKKSAKLTRILQDIVKNEKFEHFDVHFVENPINIVVNKQHVNISAFLDAVDSLHPNQGAQPLLTRALWNSMVNSLPPEVLGPINPFNEDIIRVFGDQGGH